MNPYPNPSARPPRYNRRFQGGFSLVELLVSAAILAVTVSGFYLTFGGANDLAVKARLNTSAKILLGAAANEALGSRWTDKYTPEAVTLPANNVPYDTKNEGRNAVPNPRPAKGDVSFFTSPTEENVVRGEMRRTTVVYAEPTGTLRNDMRKITFRVRYLYKGVWSEWIELQTVVTRD